MDTTIKPCAVDESDKWRSPSGPKGEERTKVLPQGVSSSSFSAPMRRFWCRLHPCAPHFGLQPDESLSESSKAKRCFSVDGAQLGYCGGVIDASCFGKRDADRQRIRRALCQLSSLLGSCSSSCCRFQLVGCPSTVEAGPAPAQPANRHQPSSNATSHKPSHPCRLSAVSASLCL